MTTRKSRTSNVVELPRGCFLKIECKDPEGYGPFSISSYGISPQMILVLEEMIKEYKDELFHIIQEEVPEEGDSA